MTRGNRKKSLKYGIIICLLTCSFIIGSILLYNIYRESQITQPEKLLEEYMGYIEAKEYEKLYAYLGTESKNSISEDDFITKNQNIYEGIQCSNLSIQVTEVEKVSSSQIQIDYDTVMDSVAGEISFTNTSLWTLDETENEYRLVWSTKLIFPELNNGYKVQVNTLSGKRGTIYDRNGSILAGEGVASSVGLVPGKMTDETDLETLASLLGVSIEKIEKALNASWVKDDSFVPIKTIKKPSDLEPDPEDKALHDALLEIPGVLITDTKMRLYPYGEIAAHLTGYVQKATAEDLEADEDGIYNESSDIGKIGLEYLYEEQLRGIDGAQIVIADGDGNKTATIAKISAQHGKDIYLTIDMSIQYKLYEQYNEDKSCSAAINPKTGEVLALVSTPAYDPNEFTMGMSSEKWTLLNEDENMPLFNRFRAAYVPGSSFKSVIAAIGVSEGIINPDEDFGTSGLSWQKDSSWGSYYVTTLHAANPATLRNALVCSDNVYFAKAALRIGAENLAECLADIGFNESIPFDIVMPASSFSSEGTISTEVQLADSGYGQGELQVNILHLASIYSAFVNDGNMIQPYLEYESAPEPSYWIEDAFTAEAAETVRDALIGAIEESGGSGHAAKVDGLVLAGKTGTAEIKASKDDDTGTELGWFCVFTPDKNAEESVLIISMVEDVKDRGGSGYLLGRSKSIFEAIYGLNN